MDPFKEPHKGPSVKECWSRLKALESHRHTAYNAPRGSFVLMLGSLLGFLKGVHKGFDKATIRVLGVLRVVTASESDRGCQRGPQ